MDMSEKDLKPARPMMGFGRGPGSHNTIGRPIEKAKDFKGTLRRLLTYLKPHRVKFIIIFLATVVSTVFNIISPKVMGQAITKLFEGFLMKMKGLPNAAIDFKYIFNIILNLNRNICRQCYI